MLHPPSTLDPPGTLNPLSTLNPPRILNPLSTLDPPEYLYALSPLEYTYPWFITSILRFTSAPNLIHATDTGRSQFVVFPGASESELQQHTRQRARDSQHTSQRV